MSEKKSIRDRVKALVESGGMKDTQGSALAMKAWAFVLASCSGNVSLWTESQVADLEAQVTFLERLHLSAGEYPLSGESRWRLLMGLFGREALLVNETCPKRVSEAFTTLSSWEPVDGRGSFPEGVSREVETWVHGLPTSSWEARSLQDVDLLLWSRKRQTEMDIERVGKVLGAISEGRLLWDLSGDSYFAWLEVSTWARIGGSVFPHGYTSVLEEFLKTRAGREGALQQGAGDVAFLTGHYRQMVADLQEPWVPPLEIQEALDAFPGEGDRESLSIEDLRWLIPVLEAAVADQLVLRRVKQIRESQKLRQEGERFRASCERAVEALRGREGVPSLVRSAGLFLEGYLLDTMLFSGSVGRERMRQCLNVAQSWLSDPARAKK